MKVFVCILALFVVGCLGQAETQVEPDDCAFPCPAIYDPVCCTYADGSTMSHGSACAAESYNCFEEITPTATAVGECSAEAEQPADPELVDPIQPAEPACPQMMCTAMHDPVCCTYSDGSTRTFGSACEASNINCLEGKTCEQQSRGECGRFHIMPFPYYPFRPMRPFVYMPYRPMRPTAPIAPPTQETQAPEAPQA